MEQIPLFKPFLAPRYELMPALERALYDGVLNEGPAVVAFEKAFGEYIGAEGCVAVSSCTAALHLAVLLSSPHSNHAVFSTAMTAEATNMAIRHAGCFSVFLDVNPRTGNIVWKESKKIIDHATVMVVNYGGIPVSLNAFPTDVTIIEDAAHSLGAKRNGLMISPRSRFTAFSFQAIKHLTTIDGGMLVCRDKDDAIRARKLRWFGMDRTHTDRTTIEVNEVGYKYNMTDVTATMGLVQLKHVPMIVRKHQDHAKYLMGIIRGVEFATESKGDEASYWFLTVLSDNRDALEKHLLAHGISCGRAHRRNDEHPVFLGVRSLPGLDSFYSRMLHIPCGWWLSSEQLEYIGDAVNQFTGRSWC